MMRCMFLIMLLGASACYGTLESSPLTGSGTPYSEANPPQPPSMSTQSPAPVDPLSTDANKFYGASRCTQAELGMCDGFEGEAVGAAPDPNIWNIETTSSNGQSVRVDGTRAARGSRSLLVHAQDGGYGHAMVVHRKFFPVPSNTFYGRAFVYFAGQVPQAHFSLFTARGTFPNASSPTYVRYGGQYGLLLANYVGNDQYQHAGVDVNGTWVDATPMPHDRWACMEWQFKGDTNEMHFWLDGVEVPRLAVIGQSNDCCTGEVWNAPPYQEMAIGWEIYTSSRDPNIRDYNVWFDEVALDAHRIGCVR